MIVFAVAALQNGIETGAYLGEVGWVRIRSDKAIPSDVKNLTMSCQAGIWSGVAQYEREVAEPTPPALPVVRIDRGLAVFAALSDGTMIAPANEGKKALRSLARAQRRLARMPRGSNNRRKQIRRIARRQMRVANARKDFLHKTSTTIAKNHGVVVLEKLGIRNMVRSAAGTEGAPGKRVRQKAGLNRTILDQGWGMFGRFLGYKLPERGGAVAEVPARNSSRECFACGLVDDAAANTSASSVWAAVTPTTSIQTPRTSSNGGGTHR